MELTTQVAKPFEIEAVPMLAPLSRKVTVPVVAVGDIVAVRVTLVKATGVVFDTEIVIVVGASDALTATADELLDV
jgi:hypothetical protein